MEIIAVVNHKGGVAKTTTTVNLAAALAERNRRTLIIDLDPQASASVWLGVRDKGERLLKAVTSGEGLSDLVEETECGLDLVPSGGAFATLEKLAANTKGAESLLSEAVETLPERWDYILLDCPPSLNLTSVCALVAASQSLVPVAAQVLSLDPLARLLDTLWEVRGRFNPGHRLNGMFATRLDARTAHGGEVVQLLKDQFHGAVYSTTIRENIQIAEAAGFQKPITLYAPTSNGAEDYRALAKEFQKRVKDVARESKKQTENA